MFSGRHVTRKWVKPWLPHVPVLWWQAAASYQGGERAFPKKRHSGSLRVSHVPPQGPTDKYKQKKTEIGYTT